MQIETGTLAGAFVLRASDLTKLYGPTVALRSVTLVARAGEIVVVRGPNASGKSTLLRVLAGLTSPTSGSVRWINDSPSRKPRVAFVGHQTHLWDALTVDENLSLQAQLVRVGVDAALAGLDRLGLSSVLKVPVRALSSGQRRRVAIARALAGEPDVLVLDEPFASLDDGASGLVDQELARQQTHGRLLLVASHESEHTFRLATRMIWLDGGRLTSELAEVPVREFSG